MTAGTFFLPCSRLAISSQFAIGTEFCRRISRVLFGSWTGGRVWMAGVLGTGSPWLYDWIKKTPPAARHTVNSIPAITRINPPTFKDLPDLSGLFIIQINKPPCPLRQPMPSGTGFADRAKLNNAGRNKDLLPCASALAYRCGRGFATIRSNPGELQTFFAARVGIFQPVRAFRAAGQPGSYRRAAHSATAAAHPGWYGVKNALPWLYAGHFLPCKPGCRFRPFALPRVSIHRRLQPWCGIYSS